MHLVVWISDSTETWLRAQAEAVGIDGAGDLALGALAGKVLDAAPQLVTIERRDRTRMFTVEA